MTKKLTKVTQDKDNRDCLMTSLRQITTASYDLHTILIFPGVASSDANEHNKHADNIASAKAFLKSALRELDKVHFDKT